MAERPGLLRALTEPPGAGAGPDQGPEQFPAWERPQRMAPGDPVLRGSIGPEGPELDLQGLQPATREGVQGRGWRGGDVGALRPPVGEGRGEGNRRQLQNPRHPSIGARGTGEERPDAEPHPEDVPPGQELCRRSGCSPPGRVHAQDLDQRRPDGRGILWPRRAQRGRGDDAGGGALELRRPQRRRDQLRRERQGQRQRQVIRRKLPPLRSMGTPSVPVRDQGRGDEEDAGEGQRRQRGKGLGRKGRRQGSLELGKGSWTAEGRSRTTAMGTTNDPVSLLV